MARISSGSGLGSGAETFPKSETETQSIDKVPNLAQKSPNMLILPIRNFFNVAEYGLDPAFPKSEPEPQSIVTVLQHCKNITKYVAIANLEVFRKYFHTI